MHVLDGGRSCIETVPAAASPAPSSASDYKLPCRGQRAGQAHEKVTVPVVVLAGEGDKSAPLGWCRQMFEEVSTGFTMQVEWSSDTERGVGK